MNNVKIRKRRRLTKEERQKIYESTGGRCAYCGQSITIEEMQVDHIFPIYRGGTDKLENMLPACRACNFYKSTMPLEDFRNRVQTLTERLEKLFIYRLAKKHGLINETHKSPIKFWFEQYRPEGKNE